MDTTGHTTKQRERRHMTAHSVTPRVVVADYINASQQCPWLIALQISEFKLSQRNRSLDLTQSHLAKSIISLTRLTSALRIGISHG